MVFTVTIIFVLWKNTYPRIFWWTNTVFADALLKHSKLYESGKNWVFFDANFFIINFLLFIIVSKFILSLVDVVFRVWNIRFRKRIWLKWPISELHDSKWSWRETLGLVIWDYTKPEIHNTCQISFKIHPSLCLGH